MDRRHVIKAMLGAAVTSATLCPSCAARAGGSLFGEGTVLCAEGGGFDPETLEILKGTGVPSLDKALVLELGAQSKFFALRPAFYIYTGGVPNAAALTQTYSVTPDTDGTIVYQLELLQEHLARGKYGGSVVAGVIAHEFTHIAQYAHPELYLRLRDRHKTVKFVELHADYVAGYYMGTKFGKHFDDIEELAQAIFSVGDDNFTNEAHHGTPEQRYVALKAGFNLERNVAGLGIERVLGEGEKFVDEYFPSFDRQ